MESRIRLRDTHNTPYCKMDQMPTSYEFFVEAQFKVQVRRHVVNIKNCPYIYWAMLSCLVAMGTSVCHEDHTLAQNRTQGFELLPQQGANSISINLIP